MKTARPIYDEYVQDFVGVPTIVSRVPDIDLGRSAFFRRGERDSGTYQLCHTLTGYVLIRSGDSEFPPAELASELDLDEGQSLMDWFVHHDWQVRYAMRHIEDDPTAYLGIIMRAYESVS